MVNAKIEWQYIDTAFTDIAPDLEAFSDFETVGRSEARVLLKGPMGGRQIYVKLYLNPSIFDFIRYCFKKNKSVKEYENTIMLAKKGIKVPQAIAAGTFSSKGRGEGGIFVCGEIPGGRPLSEKIREAPDILTIKFCDFVKELHKKGIYQSDFHLDNILVAPAGMYLIDLQRVRYFDAGLPRRLIFGNLVNANMFLRENLGIKYQKMFFERYFMKDCGKIFENIEEMSDECFYRLWKRRDGKALENREDYAVKKIKGSKYAAKIKFLAAAGESLVEDIGKLFEAGDIIKDDVKTSVRMLNCGGYDLAVKKYKKTSVLRFPSVKALNSWKGSVGLKIRKVATPEALMAVQRRGNAGYFIAENRKNIIRIDEFLKRQSLSGEKRREIIANTGKFFADLHNKGIYHRDTKPGNIFVAEDSLSISILDTDRIQFLRFVSPRKKIKNFRRLIDNIGDVLERGDKEVFLRAYFADIRFPDAGFKRKLKKILIEG
ncbi:MAG: lipopolysaccharide kinase InaA family protein [bacterium]|nr:lipopolysaccharide kinase InaA family protein [bacterium]